MFVLMGGGVLAGVSSAVKTVHIKLIALSNDITYGVTDLVIWGLVECWLVLILGSLPPLRSLFLRLSEQVTASSRSRRPTHGYQRSKTDKVIPMYPRGKRANGEEVSHESEENIVTNETDIVKTTDIHISRGGGKRWGGSDKDSTRMETVEV